MKITAGIVVSFCLFTLISCAGVSKFGGMKKTVEFDQKTFSEQKRLWHDSNVTHYQYQLFAIGFIPYYGTVFVEDGKYKNDAPLDMNFDINDFLDYSTIDKVYETIGRMFDSNKEELSEKAVYMTRISVEYDKINHVPLTIKYHYHIPPDVAYDGTSDYKIENFQKLE
jgi:hypothetical protein